MSDLGTSQWLGLHASTAEGTGLIPGWGTKIWHAGGAAKKQKKNNIVKQLSFKKKLFKSMIHTSKNFQAVSYKLNTQLLYNPVTTLLGICPREMKTYLHIKACR